METVILLLFCLSLFICLVCNLSVLYALFFGLLLFFIYGKRKGFSFRQLGKMALSGILAIKSILTVFLLIGMLTALWRACGTIPIIVCYAARLIRPSILLLMAFLLNCGVSFLMGSALGTAATMGVGCMTVAVAMGVNPAIVGGAILSGIYFGDRCSPVSTSALLICNLTDTDIFTNIKLMFRTALVPFIASCVVYTLLGLGMHGSANSVWIEGLLANSFQLHWLALLPAAAILLLSAFHVRVKRSMLISIVIAFVLCITLQQMSLSDMPRLLLLGYRADDPNVAKLLNGGGILSMVKVTIIVCLSSAYSGIFRETGLLDRIKDSVERLSRRITPFGSIVCTSVISSMVACNQTLAIMLTHQLCSKTVPDKQAFAIALENSAVVIAPLVPWAIAAAIPLATLPAPTTSLLFACYLYLIPLWQLFAALRRQKNDCKK